MNLPNLKLDWTINISQIGSILVFLATAMGGYYDLKSDVRRNQDIANERFLQVERSLTGQQALDKAQDDRVAASNADLKTQLRDQAGEIKQDIRDLRNDLMRQTVKR